MLTLTDASRTQSRPAAIQSPVALGMAMSARQEGQDGTDEKIRPAAPEARPGAVAVVADDRLHEQACDRRGEPEQRDVALTGAEILVDGAHVGHLQAPAELDAEEPETHVPDRGKGKRAQGLSWGRSVLRGLAVVAKGSVAGAVVKFDPVVKLGGLFAGEAGQLGRG